MSEYSLNPSNDRQSLHQKKIFLVYEQFSKDETVSFVFLELNCKLDGCDDTCCRQTERVVNGVDSEQMSRNYNAVKFLQELRTM